MKVGITGHQNIGSEDTVKWVKRSLENIVTNSKIDEGYTCLARGADQIYAQILIEHNVPYTAIIASADYEQTFDSAEYRAAYIDYLQHAAQVIILDHKEATEQAFYDAGEMLVDNSDYIVAVWNGLKAKGLGGTGDIVEYALKQNKRVIHLHTAKLQILELSQE